MQCKRTLLSLLALTLIVVVAAGCSAAKTPTPAAVPTKTPRPTFTPAVAVSPTRSLGSTATRASVGAAVVTVEATQPAAASTPQAAATTAPVAQPTAAPQAAAQPTTPQISAGQTVNVRQGPGTNYPVLGQLQAGETYKVTAKNSDGSWYQFNYNGDLGWASASLVSFSGDANVKVAQNIPAAPTQPPAPTAAPVVVVVQPTQPPAPAAPTAAPAPAQPAYQWSLASSGQAGAQCGVVHFNGQVQYKDGSAQNGVCLLLDYYGPRTIKFSGGGGSGNGNWSFSPCGAQACNGPFQIYVVQCPSDIGSQEAGKSLDPGSAAPPALSEKFTATVTDKCVTGQWEGIIFRNNQ